MAADTHSIGMAAAFLRAHAGLVSTLPDLTIDDKELVALTHLPAVDDATAVDEGSSIADTVDACRIFAALLDSAPPRLSCTVGTEATADDKTRAAAFRAAALLSNHPVPHPRAGILQTVPRARWGPLFELARFLMLPPAMCEPLEAAAAVASESPQGWEDARDRVATRLAPIAAHTLYAASSMNSEEEEAAKVALLALFAPSAAFRPQCLLHWVALKDFVGLNWLLCVHDHNPLDSSAFVLRRLAKINADASWGELPWGAWSLDGASRWLLHGVRVHDVMSIGAAGGGDPTFLIQLLTLFLTRTADEVGNVRAAEHAMTLALALDDIPLQNALTMLVLRRSRERALCRGLLAAVCKALDRHHDVVAIGRLFSSALPHAAVRCLIQETAFQLPQLLHERLLDVLLSLPRGSDGSRVVVSEASWTELAKSLVTGPCPKEAHAARIRMLDRILAEGTDDSETDVPGGARKHLVWSVIKAALCTRSWSLVDWGVERMRPLGGLGPSQWVRGERVSVGAFVSAAPGFRDAVQGLAFVAWLYLHVGARTTSWSEFLLTVVCRSVGEARALVTGAVEDVLADTALDAPVRTAIISAMIFPGESPHDDLHLRALAVVETALVGRLGARFPAHAACSLVDVMEEASTPSSR